MTAEASARGRASRSKGHRAEREIVAWLRDHGYPDAATTRSRLGHDGFAAPGDIIGVPGLVIESKSVRASAWPTWCRQAAAEAGQTPWVVVRRLDRCGDVGAWPCVASLTALDVADARRNVYQWTLTVCLNRLARDGWPTGVWLRSNAWVDPSGPMPVAVGRFAWLHDGAAS